MTLMKFIGDFNLKLTSSVELTNQLRDSRAKFLITTPECVIRAKAASENIEKFRYKIFY